MAVPPPPPSFDWRDHDAELMDTYPIRRQRGWDFCWAISSADVVGFKLKLDDPNTPDFLLSAQNLVEGVITSTWPENGETVRPLTKYTKAHLDGKRHGEYTVQNTDVFLFCKHHGITFENVFPYAFGRQFNADQLPQFPRVKVDAFDTLFGATRQRIREVISSQPVMGFMHTYKSFNDWRGKGDEVYLRHTPLPNEQKRGHFVVVIGYGGTEENNNEFYIIRNSWGPHWGDNGYAKVARGLVVLGHYPTRVRIERE